MLSEEYGLPTEDRQPLRAATTTFSAFLICGAAPLAPYLLGVDSPFPWAIALTGSVFFAIGSVQSRWSVYPWWLAGASTLAVGGVAAGLAYLVGYLLRGFGVG